MFGAHVEIKMTGTNHGEKINIGRAMNNIYTKSGSIPDFGFRREHRGTYSLAQFAMDNNLDL